MPDPATVVDILVEDKARDAELGAWTLKKGGLADQLAWPKGGQQALDFLSVGGAIAGRNARRGPKVILPDNRLPKVSGLEELRKIDSEPRLKTIPVVMLASSTVGGDKDPSYTLRASSFMGKQVDIGNLTGVIEQLGQYWLKTNRPPSAWD